MAAAMNVCPLRSSASSSTQPAPASLPWHRLPLLATLTRTLPWHRLPLLATLTRSKPVNKGCVLTPISCRFSRPSRSPSYGSRRVGVASHVEASGVATSVAVRVAYELLQAGHRYLDVRTPEEFTAGHVPGAVNIPYMLRVGAGMAKNPNFLAQVSSQFGKDDEILIGCQSGKRSLMAANDLKSAGYTGIMDVAGGYAAWTQTDLPIQS